MIEYRQIYTKRGVVVVETRRPVLEPIPQVGEIVISKSTERLFYVEGTSEGLLVLRCMDGLIPETIMRPRQSFRRTDGLLYPSEITQVTVLGE